MHNTTTIDQVRESLKVKAPSLYQLIMARKRARAEAIVTKEKEVKEMSEPEGFEKEMDELMSQQSIEPHV